MPVDAKPLFRPDVLRSHLADFKLPSVEASKLTHWAGLISSGRLDGFKEHEILRDFLNDFFVGVLGYTRPAHGHERYTISWEKHVEVDGKFADAVLGDFNGEQRFVVALEGKGPRDPLDRPCAGRRMSAVDQRFRYAINLKCDWVIVTSMRQRRLYNKGSDQQTSERFDTEQLADNEAERPTSKLCAVNLIARRLSCITEKSFFCGNESLRQRVRFDTAPRNGANQPL